MVVARPICKMELDEKNAKFKTGVKGDSWL